MSDLTNFLLHTFSQPANLAIFNFDGVPTVYAQLDLAPPLESPLHISRLLELLESDSALAEAFWSKFRQSYPRRVLAWPDAPQDEADWARQVDMTLQACAALVEATTPLNDDLMAACRLWPLRSAEDMTMLLPAVVRKDRKLTSRLLTLDWPDDPLSLVNSLPSLPLDLTQERAIFIAALADRLARQLDYTPHIAEIVTQIEAVWPTNWQTLGQIVKVNEAEPAKPDEPPAPEVTMMRIGTDLFLGRKMEQAQFRQVLTHMTTQPISKTATPKLFHFYGHGGMGKTQMTRCLEQIAQTEFQWTVYRYDWQRLSDKEMLPRTLDPFDLTALALTTLAEAWLEGTDLSNFQQAIARYHTMHDRVRQSLSQIPFESRFAPLRDYNPREVATMSQDERAPHHQLAQRFLEWVLAQEWLTFVSPWIPCAEALGQALQRLPQPTLFIWDTYELVDLADRWLRQIISSSQGRVVWVVAGRNNLSHNSTNDRTLAGYNDIFETYAYAMPDLQAQEVQSYFNDRLPDQPLNLTEAKQITEAVAGIPLLIKLVADEWRQGIPWAELIADLPRPTAPIQTTSNSAAPLISTMFARLLRHVRRHSLEERALYLLAMQPRPSAVWQKPMLVSADFATFYDLGQWLTTRFSHVLPANNGLLQLHDIAYEYIRAHIMRHDAHNPLVATMARQAAELCQKQRAELEQQSKLTHPKEWVKNETWCELTLDIIHWLFWGDEDAAWRELLPCLLDAWAYLQHRNYEESLIELAHRFESILSHNGQEQLEGLTLKFHQRNHLITMLEQTQPLWANSPHASVRQSILYTMRGGWLQLEEKYDEALAIYQQAIELEPTNVYCLKSLSNFFREQRDINQAITFINHALEIEPNNQELLEFKQIIIATQGDDLFEILDLFTEMSITSQEPSAEDIEDINSIPPEILKRLFQSITPNINPNNVTTATKNMNNMLGLTAKIGQDPKLIEKIQHNISIMSPKTIEHLFQSFGTSLGLDESRIQKAITYIIDLKKSDKATQAHQLELEILVARIFVLFSNKEYKQAFDLIEKLIAIEPNNEKLLAFREMIIAIQTKDLNKILNLVVTMVQNSNFQEQFQNNINFLPPEMNDTKIIMDLLVAIGQNPQLLKQIQNILISIPPEIVEHLFQSFGQRFGLDESPIKTNKILDLITQMGDDPKFLEQISKIINSMPPEITENLFQSLGHDFSFDEPLNPYKTTKVSDFFKSDKKALIHQPEFGSLVDQVYLLLDNHEYDQAIDILEKALKIEPDNQNLLILKKFLPLVTQVYLLLDKKEYEQAIDMLEKALKIDSNAKIQSLLGDIYHQLKRYDEAMSEYQQAIQLDPQSASLYLNLGNIYSDLGQYKQAITAYKQAIQLDSENAITYTNLANIYHRQGKFNEAKVIYFKAMEFEPEFTYLYTSLSVLSKQLGNLEDADSYLSEARELITDEKFLTNYIKACLENISENSSVALEYLRQAIEESPELCGWAKYDPNLESLWGLAEFWEIVGSEGN